MKLKFRHIVLLTAAGILFLGLTACSNDGKFAAEKERVIGLADSFINEEPVTITDTLCERSAGGVHDYYSEGDYWWPDPENPEGPYIRKDGLTNPENFTAHREAMRRFSMIVPALTAAYAVTDNSSYAEAALKHVKAWFVNESTMMNPNLLFAQAIKGKVTGRGIGIIDTIHLVEVVKAVIILHEKGAIPEEDYTKIQAWFEKYLSWITTHEFGIDERDNGNNHSTCWAMQVAMYAEITGNEEQSEFVRDFYKEVLLPGQMAEDGSFPKELARTKPYGYSLFNLDAMAMVCEIAGNENNDLWNYTTEDGRGMKKAVEFMYPFIKDKNEWPYQKDVMHWEEWPVRQPSLILAYEHFGDEKYLELWKTLDPDPVSEEIIRNYPIRQPLLWVN